MLFLSLPESHIILPQGKKSSKGMNQAKRVTESETTQKAVKLYGRKLFKDRFLLQEFQNTEKQPFPCCKMYVMIY